MTLPPAEKKCLVLIQIFFFYNVCNSNFPSLICPDGSIACFPNDKANLFGSYFSKILLSAIPMLLNLPLNPSLTIFTPICLLIKTDEASGPDSIPPRFLKEFAEEFPPVLCCFFCFILLISCSYPSWKHALVHPVPKKDDRSNPSSYRLIALTSAVAEVVKAVLNSHFIKHLKSNNLLSDHQYGFLKARSTGDLLSCLTHTWSSSLRDLGESFIVAFDILKAFGIRLC